MPNNIYKQNITKYLRDTIGAQSNMTLNFKYQDFYSIQFNDFRMGNVKRDIFSNMLYKSKLSRDISSINVILIVKTIKTKYENQLKVNSSIEDLTGILFVPAILHKNGRLFPDLKNNRVPWIPREYLEPMTEPILSLGHYKYYDEFMSNNLHKIYNIDGWYEYYAFCCDLFKNVTSSELINSTINDLETEDVVYIVQDNTINSTFHIAQLYDDIIENRDVELPLYDRIIRINTVDEKPLINLMLENMALHKGSMNNMFPLSPSQRECINHFTSIEQGEVLAVNGPPGTGKTTLIQSIVANMVVDYALKKLSPPIIVAASTNNQAVTNIIESFGQANNGHDNGINNRWVCNSNSLAVYFPSSAREKAAEDKGYQYTSNRGDNFVALLDNQKNINNSKENFLLRLNDYFNTSIDDTSIAEDMLHDSLIFLNNCLTKLLKISKELEEIIGANSSLESYLDDVESEILNTNRQLLERSTRLNEWVDYFDKLPLKYKVFGFTKKNEQYLRNMTRLFMNIEESLLLENATKYHEIENIYGNIIWEYKQNMHNLKSLHSKVSELRYEYMDIIKGLNDYNINFDFPSDSIHNHLELNKYLDRSIRYHMFWIAIHFYEARWMNGVDSLTEKEKGKTYKSILDKYFNRLSMITPCYVMTFHQLPKVFQSYEGNGKYSYLYNKIDLLIVDEAGQVTPEVAVCSFSLAKKAVVVGDVNQIEPIWNINEPLDKALMKNNSLIASREEFTLFKKIGLNTSSSNLMKLTSNHCPYIKHGERGLFLEEHRRCYDDIISYCNELVYGGNLIPMRGSGEGSILRETMNLPAMGIRQISSTKSVKCNNSRINIVEANEVVDWIKSNYDTILKAYGESNAKSTIGIITPFAEQAKYIEKCLHDNNINHISVGTVHTFQGAERNIILFSSVYGSEDSTFFIDKDKSMLNVAISRAKDHFIVFGDIRAFSENIYTPSGLLKKYVFENLI